MSMAGNTDRLTKVAVSDDTALIKSGLRGKGKSTTTQVHEGVSPLRICSYRAIFDFQIIHAPENVTNERETCQVSGV